MIFLDEQTSLFDCFQTCKILNKNPLEYLGIFDAELKLFCGNNLIFSRLLSNVKY